MFNKTEQSYRRSAIEGASTLGLMIVLFDRLVSDLRRAAAALRKNDIETRVREFSHALHVLAQLESWIDMERGGHSAKAISLFFAQIREKMMEAGVQKSAAILDKQIDAIVNVRSAWQLLDTSPSMPDFTAVPTPLPEHQQERTPFSLSA